MTARWSNGSSIERRPHAPGHLVLLQHAIGHREAPRFGSSPCAAAVLVERHLLRPVPPPPPALPVGRLIDDDAVDPGAQRRLPAETRQRPEHAQEHFLRQVERFLRIAEQVQRQLVDHALVVGDQPRARGLVSGGTLLTSAQSALVQQCAAGDEAACTRLVTDYQRMVYQLGFHLLGDSQEALDMSQEVFLRVFRTLPSFRGQSTLRTWIYRIVVNQASNRLRWWRRRHRSQQVPIDDHGVGERALAESRSFAMPDRVLQQHEMATRVWAALNELPFDQRAAVVLREIDGLSYEEISSSLGIAVGTVKSRLARARSVLRDLLGPQ